MIINIAIVDDDTASADILDNYVKKYQNGADDSFVVERHSDGEKLLKGYKGGYDIIFLDIIMKRLDGMAVARKIRETDKNVIIVFVTSLAQYAIKGYAVDALDFLVKPVSYSAFMLPFKKAIARIKARQASFVMLPTENGVLKMDLNGVYYFESFGHTILAKTESDSIRMIDSLNVLEKKLAANNFFRCERSFLINLALVNSYKGNEISIGQHKVAVGRTRKKAFSEALSKYYSM